MTVKTIKNIFITALAACALGSAAQAQSQDFINYYLSPQSQIDGSIMSNWYATQAANSWMQHCNQLRAQGYTGEIYCPLANTQTLVNSNRELQNTYDSYNQGYWNNQAAYDQSAVNYSNGYRDQQQMYDSSGNGYWTQPSTGTYQWYDPYSGYVTGSDSYYPPNYYNNYQQLQPYNYYGY